MFGKYLFLIATGVLFGVQFLFNTYALTTLTPLTIGVGRVFFGWLTLLILFPLFLKQEKKQKGLVKGHWHQYALLGFFEAALPCLALPFGQEGTDSGIASILISTMPLFAIIFASLLKLDNEKLAWHKILSVVVGFIGVAFIIHPSSFSTLWKEIGPELLVLLAAASWGFGLALLKKFPPVHPIRLCRNFLFFATLELALIWILFGHPTQTHFSPLSFWSLVFLGSVNAGIVYIFYTLLTRIGGVAFASFSNYIVPIVGLGLGALFLHETITIYAIIGLVIVFLGLGIHSYYDRAKI